MTLSSYNKENFFCKKVLVFLKNLSASAEPVLFSNLSQARGFTANVSSFSADFRLKSETTANAMPQRRNIQENKASPNTC